MKSAAVAAKPRSPNHALPRLAPLLLALAVSQAYATEQILTGANGASGLSGLVAGQSGTAGWFGVSLGGAQNDIMSGKLTVIGGAGGAGGNGGLRTEAVNGGDGGAGGNGGSASSNMVSSTGASPALAEARAFGGMGGRAGDPGYIEGEQEEYPTYMAYDPAYGKGGVGGAGGDAYSQARATATGSASATAIAYAKGGDGGAAFGRTTQAGSAGRAQASAYAQSGSGDVTVSASANGGHGGDTGWGFGSRGAGPRGADVELFNAVSGATAGLLSLTQSSVGGNGSNAFVPVYPYDENGQLPQTPSPDNGGGNARSTLTLSDGKAGALSATVSAAGGAGGAIYSTQYSGMYPANRGGDANAQLRLDSTQTGANVTGAVFASGGTGGAGVGLSPYLTNGDGGSARAEGTLSGLGLVSGNVSAQGGAAGDPYPDSYGSGQGGSAYAELTLSGTGSVSGSASAAGGANKNSLYAGDSYAGAAAVLNLRGGGAVGQSYASGGGALSAVNAVTSGALAVDVLASSSGRASGGATAAVSVDSGVGGNRAGTAAVKARAEAISDDRMNSGAVAATLSVRASGAIDAVSNARGGNSYGGDNYGSPGSGGSAIASAKGITDGNHAVNLSAIARGGDSGLPLFYARTASADADARGQSGAGRVVVSADARAGRNSQPWETRAGVYGEARAHASALTTDAGGSGKATAYAWGGAADVLAASAGRDGRGSLLTAVATGVAGNSNSYFEHGRSEKSGSASSVTGFDAGSFALADLNGETHVVSNVSGAPDAGVQIAGLGANVGAAIGTLIGTGMQAVATTVGNDLSTVWEQPNILGQLATSSQFQFQAYSGQHLLIGFVSAAFLGGGFDVLDFSITNNGVGLFSHSFTSLGEAEVFFTDHVLDLGLFGAGMQDVRIASEARFYGAGGYAFNYVLGAGAAVAAVPEASSWIMMVLGLGALVLVARRRRLTPEPRA
jgi:hypothetical protein